VGLWALFGVVAETTIRNDQLARRDEGFQHDALQLQGRVAIILREEDYHLVVANQGQFDVEEEG
jgi:hypothetical protein